MKDAFERTVWFVIAAALSVIALNPWIAPTPLGAASGIMNVNVEQIGGKSLSYGEAIPVEIVGRGK